MTDAERYLRVIIANLEATLTWQAAQLRLLERKVAGLQAVAYRYEATIQEQERRLRLVEVKALEIEFSEN